MKLKIIAMIFVMLSLSVISFSDTANASIGDPKTEIKVSIMDDIIFEQLISKAPLRVLHDYSWVVNNTEYIFNATKVYNPQKYTFYLNNKKTDVLIMDGQSIDTYICSVNFILRNKYENYIDNGGGYIGRCGGADFPLPLYEDPYTPAELHMIDVNFLPSFLCSRYRLSGLSETPCWTTLGPSLII